MVDRVFDNDGIVVGGNAEIRDSALAAGSHAQARVGATERSGATASEVREALEVALRQIDELRGLLAEHFGRSPAAELADRDVQDVQDEVIRARDGGPPDPDRIRHALERLSGRVGAIGALALAVDNLKDVVIGALR